MPATLVDDIATANAVVLEPITVDQYHSMLEQGILREGAAIELIDGLLVRKDRRDGGGSIMTVGPRHATTVKLVFRLLNRLVEKLNCHVQSQQPIFASDVNEPEPDVAVILGNEEAYFQRHPKRGEVLLVIEVADSSLPFDRGKKCATYSSAGIPAYWVVNLRESIVEVYTSPNAADRRYSSCATYRSGDEIPFELDGTALTVAVSDLLKRS